MSQSLSEILVHLVFSTKDRQPFLQDGFREELHRYIGGIVSQLSGSLIAAGSVEDHIHLLIRQPRTCSLAEMVEAIKTGSSKWIKGKGSTMSAKFHWQSGYGAFSISPSHQAALVRYIGDQREHHRGVSFQDEYRKLLKKYLVEYNERYVWE